MVIICSNCALDYHRTHHLEKVPANFQISQKSSISWKKRWNAFFHFKLKKTFVNDVDYENSTETLKNLMTTPVKSPISANANKENIPHYQNVNNSSETGLNYSEII